MQLLPKDYTNNQHSGTQACMRNRDEDGATAAEIMSRNLNIPPHSPSSISFFFLFFFPLVEEEETRLLPLSERALIIIPLWIK